MIHREERNRKHREYNKTHKKEKAEYRKRYNELNREDLKKKRKLKKNAIVKEKNTDIDLVMTQLKMIFVHILR